MKYEEITKLINNVIENEFNHVQECDERDFADADKEQIELTQIAEKLFKQLCEDMPEECQKSLDEYYAATTQEWINLCKFYFRAGVIAGLTNLDFLKDTGMTNYI